MSARQARGQLANLRAMAEQAEREEMHGGGYFHGAGATPSMGLSQFRGGSRVGGAVIRAANPRIEVVEPHTSIVPYNPRAALDRTGSTLVNYRPGSTSIKPYNPAEAQAALNALRPKAVPTDAKSISQRLADMGVTSSRVMAALALGIPLLALIPYFESGADGTGNGSSGAAYYPSDPTQPPQPPQPQPPRPPMPPMPPIPPSGYPGTGAHGDQPWWSYLQTVAPKKGGRKHRGGRSDGRSARAAIVRKVMQEQGLKLIDASKYVKQHGLY